GARERRSAATDANECPTYVQACQYRGHPSTALEMKDATIIIKSHMDQSNMVEAGWRGSAEAWLDAAYEILIESGVDAVRIVPLSKKLKLSRTSFYWFFRDRESLLTALL